MNCTLLRTFQNQPVPYCLKYVSVSVLHIACECVTVLTRGHWEVPHTVCYFHSLGWDGVGKKKDKYDVFQCFFYVIDALIDMY